MRENTVIVEEDQEGVKGPRPVTRPNSFIYTLFGDFVQRDPAANDELPMGALIRLMGEFGLSSQAVRQAVSRMSRQGWLAARRSGNRAFYTVTERGRRRIETISPRIYGPVVEWDGHWRMVTYSVAESRREDRDRLRKDLTVLGFAPLSASTWISPSSRLSDVRAAAESAEVLDALDLFEGEYRGPLSDRELLEKCWDLPAIGAQYRAFVAQYEPLLARERSQNGLRDDEAFVQRMWLVHDFRKFAYVDPGLPSTLLPAQWPGTLATSLFRQYYATLSLKAERFFRAVRFDSVRS